MEWTFPTGSAERDQDRYESRLSHGGHRIVASGAQTSAPFRQRGDSVLLFLLLFLDLDRRFQKMLFRDRIVHSNNFNKGLLG